MNILSGENIVFGYRDKALISPFSFEIESGKVIGLLGLNGSGKTTFFKTLMGGIPLLSGSLLWNGKNIESLLFSERQKMFSWLPARKLIEEQLKVFEILTFSSHDVSLNEDVLKHMEVVIRLMNIESFLELPYHQLSEGQKKKVEIAALLMKKSSLLLLDEPSVFLDIDNQAELIVLIRKLSRENEKIIFISSHNLDFLKACADVCWEIKDGSLLFSTDVNLLVNTYSEKLKIKC